MKIEWYDGKYGDYRELPWLHAIHPAPPMPWAVLDVHPCGYIVFVAPGGACFKAINKPVLMAGDWIE